MRDEVTKTDIMAGDANRIEHTVSTRTMELSVAGVFMALACLIMWDNWRLGAQWGSDGPGAGYFPFRIGAIMFVVSAVTFVLHLPDLGSAQTSFVDRSQFKMVLKVLVPTVIFVALIPLTGIYVAAAIFIAFFMLWLGRYRLALVVPVAIGVPAFLFLTFEVWFLVPLPKGPLESAFGY
jgi:putative tricarboxylic transport membrane protein